MSRVQKLRLFVSQRINAALEEILTVFENMINKYEEEAALSQQVISRQHALLCALHTPLMDVPSADVFTQQLLLRNKETPPEHQDQVQIQDQVQDQVQVQIQDQEDPEPPHGKKEQEGEPLPDLDEADIIQFTYNPRRAARSGEDTKRAEPGPGPAGPDQQVQLVSSETEDSDDYGKDSTDLRSASEQPKAKKRRGAGAGFSCRVCIRTFTAHRFLFRHVRAHLQEAEPVCGLCGERFEAAEGLRLHIQTHRTTQRRRRRELESQTRTRGRDSQPNKNPRAHTCDDCGRSFLQVRKKKRHRCSKNRESPEGPALRTRT